MNGAVTLAPAAGEVIVSAGVPPPAFEPEPDEPLVPDVPDVPDEVAGVLLPHAAAASSAAAAPVVTMNVRCSRMDVLLKEDLPDTWSTRPGASSGSAG